MNGPEEPSAAARQGARAIREMFIALTLEGFNEHQALIIVGQILATSAAGGDHDGK